jgi:hypothetical protein
MAQKFEVVGHTVEVVPGVVKHHVLTYTFADGEVWEQVEEWEHRERAGWRSGRLMTFRPGEDGKPSRKTTQTKLQQKIGEFSG